MDVDVWMAVEVGRPSLVGLKSDFVVLVLESRRLPFIFSESLSGMSIVRNSD